jgi:hypothetical protein
MSDMLAGPSLDMDISFALTRAKLVAQSIEWLRPRAIVWSRFICAIEFLFIRPEILFLPVKRFDSDPDQQSPISLDIFQSEVW